MKNDRLLPHMPHGQAPCTEQEAAGTAFHRNFTLNSKLLYESIDALSFSCKTVFIIGAGPSLNKNISLFCDRVDVNRYPVICTDGAAHALANYNFVPTAVATCECDSQITHPGLPTVDLILKDLNRSHFKGVPLIAPIWGCHEFIIGWPSHQRYFFNNADTFYEEFWKTHPHLFVDEALPNIEPRAVNVGFTMIEVARYLEAKEIVLLGFDMTVYDKVHHCDGFNVDFDTYHINDVKNSYESQLTRFQLLYAEDFGVKVTNCTEGGKLCPPYISTKAMTLEEKLCEMH